jgi:hypothetical protein
MDNSKETEGREIAGLAFSSEVQKLPLLSRAWHALLLTHHLEFKSLIR